MHSIIMKLNDGGPIITYPLFVLIFVVLGLVIHVLVTKKNQSKRVDLLIHLGWFSLAWGFLGRTFGLIQAFDKVEAYGEITPKLLSGGLKMAILGPLLGIIVFIIARLGLILINLLKK